jgi:hypothetical protein
MKSMKMKELAAVFQDGYDPRNARTVAATLSGLNETRNHWGEVFG